MLDVNFNEIMQELEVDNLIFSYALKKLPTTDGMALTIHQQETGFSLTLHLKESVEELSVTGFSLAEISSLEQQSLSLYDAAVVEITMQALDLLFIMADHVDQDEIAFTISQNEANSLSAFTCFFDADFILQTSPNHYDAFVNHTEILKTKIRHELWQRQGHDRHLRHYLQNRQKGQIFREVDLVPIPIQAPLSNILTFPL